MRFCDSNPAVISWNSEELVIPYRCLTDKKMHRYFIDFVIQFKTGPIRCIEVKPKKQTIAPRPRKGNASARQLSEAATYAKNISKWSAAEKYCTDRGMIFEIWDEYTLEALGIKVLRASVKRRAKKKANK